MSLFEKAISAITKGKQNIHGTIFVKDFKKENSHLVELTKLLNSSNMDKKEIIERDIMLLKHGLSGEQNVHYELKNSFIPMLCLHDVRIEYLDYTAQLDFVLITRKFIICAVKPLASAMGI